MIEDMEVNGANILLNGDIYSKGNFKSNAVEVKGTGSINSTQKIFASVGSEINILEESSTVNMENIFEHIDQATLESRVLIEEDNILNGSIITVDKNYFSKKNTILNSAIVEMKGSLLSRGNISINTSIGRGEQEQIEEFRGQGRNFIASENGDVNIGGASFRYEGIIYAPNGTVNISASDINITGRIIAKKIAITGTNITLKEGEGDLDFIPSDLPQIILSAEHLDYDENIQGYNIKDKLDILTGVVSDITNVTEFSYEIKGLNKKVLKSGKIEIGDTWKIEDVGFTIGANYLKLLLKLNDGRNVEKEILFMNYPEKNLGNVGLDGKDTDNDKIPDYAEDILGTDSSKKDTDDDGISDLDELTKTSTNPSKNDTDSNGILDGNEDLDKDGLKNTEEIKLGLNPLAEDTDGDGLKDNDEIIKYKTDPLKFDTDSDNLNDGFEVENGLNPNKKDTDKDGLHDDKEEIKQNIDINIEKSEIVKVEVETTGIGDISNEIMIEDIKEIDTLSANVVGLKGNPIEVDPFIDLKQSTIKFTYKESLAKSINPQHLAILKYNEKTGLYDILDKDTVVDEKKKTVSYKGDINGKYMLVDRNIWYDTWKSNIDYRDPSDAASNYFDIGFVVDNSGSMKGERILMSKLAMRSFVDLQHNSDNGFIITFNDRGKVIAPFGSSRETLREAITSINAGGGTDTNVGLKVGIEEMISNISENSEHEKILIMICDGDVNYVQSTIDLAKEHKIKIHTINVINSSSGYLQKISSETGGKYYKAVTAENIIDVIEDIKGETINDINKTDTDGDGLYDVYEKKELEFRTVIL
ncbi:MAG: VWA domain-containing protein [Sarcina sp.]